ncbi:MAG: isoprenylcysteine carboxylmethyltransferase family protein [Anaerolineae bacterium]|nr:isoprenylcysteine carboxylmethyltransferase family protein [Anaerolineae bacterium]
MLTGIYQTIAVLLVAAVFYMMDFLFITHYDKQRRGAGSGRSWNYTLMTALMFVLVALQPVALPWLSVSTGAWWGLLIQLAGFGLVAGGLALQGWSRLHLRQFYAERVEVQPEHALIDAGPYAYVRHPIFTSFFMYVLGLLLINPSLPLLLLTGYVFWDFSRAARQEEDLLCRTLPGYTEYMTRTARFFPRIPPRQEANDYET